MKKKVLVALLAIAAVAVFLTIQEEGKENAFGGLMAPIESVRAPQQGQGHDRIGLVTGNSIPDTAQTNYKQLVDRVRSRTNDAMDQSVRRSSR